MSQSNTGLKMTTNTLDDILGDIWDVRDLISRFEELQELKDELFIAFEDLEEFQQIESILDKLKGNGGDEQWQGDWYPVTMIVENYFTEYAQDLVSDIGDMPREIPSYIEIDWDATADNIKRDYSSIDIDGNTYYFR
jgi:hypothetical protein